MRREEAVALVVGKSPDGTEVPSGVSLFGHGVDGCRFSFAPEAYDGAEST